jgi:hypothetical protein
MVMILQSNKVYSLTMTSVYHPIWDILIMSFIDISEVRSNIGRIKYIEEYMI